MLLPLASLAEKTPLIRAVRVEQNILRRQAIFFIGGREEQMVSLPPRREKLHYTFDNSSLENIGRQNFNLLLRLNSIATRPDQFAGKAGAGGGGGKGGGGGGSTRPALRSRAEIDREKQSREIDRTNAILLKKLQATKSIINPKTSGRGAGASQGAPRGSPGSGGSPGGSRPVWVDPLDSRTGAQGDNRRVSGEGGGVSRSHRDASRNLALEASREDHLYDVAPPDVTRRIAASLARESY